MAKVYTGRDGLMQVNGTTVAKVVNFQLSANLETLETTTLGDNIRTYTPGIVGYSGSASLLYYKDGNGNINTTDLLGKLYNTKPEGVTSTDTVELTFRWVDGSGDKDIKLKAYITSASLGATVGDISRAEIAFQGTEALSKVSIGS